MELVGPERARELIKAETIASDRAAEERQGDIRRLNAVLVAAREELRALRGAAEQTRRLALARQNEISRVSEPDPRLTNSQLVAGLQAEAADFSLKNRQFETSASQVEQRIGEATGALAKIDLQFRTNLTRDLAIAEQEIAALKEELASAGRIADQISLRGGNDSTSQMPLEIVRQTGGLPRNITAEPTTMLQPGDVVHVRAPAQRVGTSSAGSRP
ncbi:hypothetical protein IP69_14615 [Bosea sp. AAP35]|nr:hypothetical protein IP69_14615 [Bosea sp. AAP35]